MTLRRSSPDPLTVTGTPAAARTTSEQVASKPMPLTAAGGSAASAMAARTEAAQAAQISDDDCSTTPPASCQTVIGCRAVASKVPFSSNTPARALDVPTSTPMKACFIPIPLKVRASLDHNPIKLNRITISSLCLSIISAQTLRVCREGKSGPPSGQAQGHAFPDHALTHRAYQHV